MASTGVSKLFCMCVFASLLFRILEAPPTAELEPITEQYKQTDEVRTQ